MVLLAGQGVSNSEIARRQGVARQTVKKWRNRFVAAQESLTEQETQGASDSYLRAELGTLLDDAPRPGGPPKFEPEQVVSIVQLACTKPEDHGVPVSHWTPDLLAKQAVEQEIVDSISPSSVRRFLKGGRLEATSLPTVGDTTG
jgi:putative transposase